MSGVPTAVAHHLNGLPAVECRRELLRCCGSARWAERMLEGRPFLDDERLLEAARRVWWDLGREDWLEAFAAHPRIGERPAAGFASHEQAGMDGAAAGIRAALAEGNRRYEQRFGHVFLICATGRGADELLAELRRRLGNDPSTELREAAAEQARITELRLSRLVGR